MKSKRATRLALISVLAFVAGACGGRPVDEGTIETRLEASYVSGHLGSDQDCAASQTARSSGAFAPCQDPANCDSGRGFQCEDGAVTVQLTNTGDGTLSGLDVRQLVLQATGGGASQLTVRAVTRDDGKTFDGTLAPGASVKIRIKFPALGYAKAPKGAALEVTIVTGSGTERRVVTPELHVMPTWAT